MREAGFTEQRSPPSPVSGRITGRWLSGPHSLSGFSIGPSLFSPSVTDLGPPAFSSLGHAVLFAAFRYTTPPEMEIA
ncbi:hypothetical protein LINGRAHAP2_LOCUS12907 [Linum grandiflorum]